MSGEATVPPGGSKPQPSVPESGSGGEGGLADRIPGYRLVHKLGEGGMGVVYEAEQENPRRRVAIKIVRGGAYIDEHQIRLFVREAQALGQLRHPGIAAIYEAGRTSVGRHFFSMEIVRGVPLDQHLRARAASVSSRDEIAYRLALFREVCDAISYAHQRGVIHRDLKPSNILVVDDGHGAEGARIKILDFGLARITDADVALTTMVTEVGRIQGTLAYMSPEQARGNPRDIDVRSDVYALGVIFFEMLAGRLPYDVHGVAMPEAIRRITEAEPERPSTVVRALRGDLETIALKALEKDPARRYQSAAALSEDVGRYLSRQPILARPPSAAYQLRKLAARHRAAAALLATLFAVLAASTITMTVLYRGQSRERAKAEGEARKAEAVSGFLRSMLSAVDPKSALGREPTVREVVDAAAGRIDRELAEQPDVQAALRATMGTAYVSLGEYDVAGPLLTSAFEAQMRLRGAADGDVASTASHLGELYSRRGEYAAAESVARYYLAQVLAASGAGTSAHSSALDGVASALFAQARAEAEAESLLLEAVAIRERIGRANDADYASILATLGNVQQRMGKSAQAESTMTRALAIRRAVLNEEHPDIALSLHNLGAVYREGGDNARAESYFMQSLAIKKRVLGERHPSVATTLNSLGAVRAAQGKYAEAESTHREVIAIMSESYGPDHADLARAKGNLAKTLEAAGRHTEAEAYQREALAAFQKNFGAEHRTVAIALTSLAAHIHKQGRLEEAETLLRESLEMKRRTLGPEHESVGETLTRLGAVLLDRKRASESEEVLRDARRVLEGSLSEGHWRLAQVDCFLGSALVEEGRAAEGESLLVRGQSAIAASPNIALDIRQAAAERLAAFYERTERPQLAAETRRLASSAPPSPPTP